MNDNQVQIRISAINQAAAGINEAIDSLNGLGNQVALMATKFNMIASAAQTAFQGVARVITPALDAVRDFQEGIVKTAALITSFEGNKGNVAENYRQAKLYAEGLQQALQVVNTKTLASAGDLDLMTQEMMKQRIVLDVNNQKQLDAFANIANAAAVVAMGYPNKEIQLRQEIRALMAGQVNANSQLASQVDAMVGGNLKAEVALHKKSGDLIEWMGGLLVGYKAATGDIQSLWSTITTSMSTIVNQVLRGGFAPAFKEIVAYAQQLTDWASEHKEQLAQMVNRGWLIIKGLVETVVNLFEPLLGSAGSLGDIVAGILKGLGYIVSAVLPPLATRVGEIAAGMYEWVKMALNLGLLLWKAFSFDWDGLKSTWADIQANYTQAGLHAGKAFQSGFLKEVGERAADFDQTFGNNKVKAPTIHLGNAPDAKKKTPSRAPDWKAELERMLEDEGNFFRDSKAKELEFWESKLALTKKGTAERRAVEHEIFQVKSAMAKEELGAQLQGLRDQNDAALKGSVDRINIARQEAELIKSKYGEQSKEYAAMLRQVNKAMREYEADQIKRQEALLEKKKELDLVGIDMENDRITYLKGIGEINNEQEIAAQIALEERRFQIQQSYDRERAMALREGSIERQKALQQLEIAETKHLQRIQQMNLQAATTVNRQWTSVFSSMVNSMEAGIQSMLKGTLTWQRAWNYVMGSMLQGFTDMIKKQIVTHLAAEMTKTTATTAGVAARSTVETAGHLQGIALAIWASLKRIAIAAYTAGAEAYQAVVGIPVVGPVLAPVAAAAAFTGVMAFGATMASAAGGYDIPAGVNPLVQTHAEEMILPAELSNKIRGMTDAGGGTTHVTIHAVDAKSIKRLFRENGPALTGAIRAHARNLNGVTA